MLFLVPYLEKNNKKPQRTQTLLIPSSNFNMTFIIMIFTAVQELLV